MAVVMILKVTTLEKKLMLSIFKTIYLRKVTDGEENKGLTIKNPKCMAPGVLVRHFS